MFRVEACDSEHVQAFCVLKAIYILKLICFESGDVLYSA